MNEPNTPRFVGRYRWVLVVVFLLSGTGLAYEIALTRLFSLMFQYHDVFLIVTLSVSGLGVGSALAIFATRNTEQTIVWSDLARAALLLSLLMVGSSAILSQLSSAKLKLVAFGAAALPFIAIGFINAVLFGHFAQSGGTLYASDLIGAAIGTVAVLGMVTWLGAFDTVAALGVFCALSAILLAAIGQHNALKRVATAVTLMLTVVVIANVTADILVFSPDELEDTPPDKTMMRVLDSDPSAKIIETEWGPFARLDVVTTRDESVRYVFTDGGAASTMVRFDDDTRRVSWLTQEVAYLPFAVEAEQTRNVLILGAGAGKDVLMAHLAGIESITAVEINPLMIDLTRDYADYNGAVLDLPGVEVVATDGRNYVERSDDTYDLIYANLVYSQAAAPSTSALAESYVFTREALHTYWDRLSENGRIGFVLHHGIEGLRLMVATLDMLQDEGFTLQQALRHVSLASFQGSDPQTRTSVLLVTRQPWEGSSVNTYVSEAHRRNAGFLYMPVYQEIGLEAMLVGAITLEDYIDANSDRFDYTPTTDDWPFFYQYDVGTPGQLNDLLLISLFVAGVYLSWVMFFYVRRDRSHWKRAALAPYFAALGAGFMLVEIPLIQRFNLLLGQPSLTLVVVIGTLLVSGGVSSLLSNQLPVRALPRAVPAIAMLVVLLTIGAQFVYPSLIDAALSLDLVMRIGVTVIAVIPFGLLMGIPFPSGLRVANEVDSRGVAAFWGANATASVLGTALAMILAINVGFSATFLAGAALYAVAAVLTLISWPLMFSR